jgi:hypothetical protein
LIPVIFNDRALPAETRLVIGVDTALKKMADETLAAVAKEKATKLQSMKTEVKKEVAATAGDDEDLAREPAAKKLKGGGGAKAAKADVGDCEGEGADTPATVGGGKGTPMKLGKLAAGTRKKVIGKQRDLA